MLYVNKEYVDALFLMGDCIVCGDTSFYRTRVYVGGHSECIQVVGPNHTMAFDLMEFEDQLCDVITTNYELGA